MQASYGTALYGSSTYLDSTGETVLCWPVDTSQCPGYDERPEEQRLLAGMLAGETLRMLTGYRMGGCPITLRPTGSCWSSGFGALTPVLLGGRWFNGGCGCSMPSTITLPVETGRIVEVLVDGVAVDPSAYRLDGATRLVRIDGEPWPRHQDLDRPTTDPGTFAVTYVPGLPVDALGARAAGLLACEFVKSMEGKACALPRNATNVSRQGVTIDLDPAAFGTGRTGIREVDLYVQRWNPHRLAAPSTVWSPGTVGPRDPRGLLMPAYGPQGPQGVQGATGLPGLAGAPGSGDAVLFTQASPSATWTIPHTFHRVPDVIVYDETGFVIYPDVAATDLAVTITFANPTAGSAVLT